MGLRLLESAEEHCTLEHVDYEVGCSTLFSLTLRYITCSLPVRSHAACETLTNRRLVPPPRRAHLREPGAQPRALHRLRRAVCAAHLAGYVRPELLPG